MSTDDSPEREFDLYDSEGLPVTTLEYEESTSNVSENEATSNRRENSKPSRKPRREVWWFDLGTTNHSLMSVGRCFEDRLNWSLLSSSNSLLPHIRSPKDDNLRRNLHQCPGYLREEIALTCDLSKSSIVSHPFPGPSERCSICHQLVQYTYPDSFDIYIVPYMLDCSPSPVLSVRLTRARLRTTAVSALSVARFAIFLASIAIIFTIRASITLLFMENGVQECLMLGSEIGRYFMIVLQESSYKCVDTWASRYPYTYSKWDIQDQEEERFRSSVVKLMAYAYHKKKGRISC